MTDEWLRFLTDRDKEHLAATGRTPKTPFGLGQRPAVLVIDDYYSALGLKREPLLESVRSWPASCGLDGWDAIDRTVELIDVARQTDVPVIYVKAMTDLPSPWNRGLLDSLDHLPEEERARANEIVEEIAPRPGDVVIAKSAPSSFQGTPLNFHLRALAIDTLVVCGETTSGCVRATVVDGATLRYRVAVVKECCFDRTEASHWINLFDMHHKYADVVDLASAVTYLRSVNRQSA